MKNILKKLGVLGLMTFIIPFINVSATGASCEGGEIHLQNYMFLDINIPESFVAYEDDGYTTYGNFPYTFSAPTDNSTVKVVNVTRNHPRTSQEVDAFWRLYNTVYQYSALNNTFKIQSAENFGKMFVSTTDKNYTTNTILLHGRWARDGEDDATKSKWGYIDGSTAKTLQDAGTNFADDMEIIIDGAKYNNTTNEFSEIKTSSSENLTEHFNKLISGNFETNEMWSANDEKYIPLEITRKIDEDYFNSDDVIFGDSYMDGNKKVYRVYSMSTKNTDDAETEIDESKTIDIKDVDDSYDAFKAFLEQKDGDTKVYAYELEDQRDYNKIDFFRDEEYYWPFVLNVEYEVCPVSEKAPETPGEPVPEKEWTLKYDANLKEGEDATTVLNLPKSQTAKVKQEITIDSGTPSKTDNTFINWCETRNGSGACYKPGDKIKKDEEGTVTLFAQWGATTPVDPEETGVVSYIIGFSAVALIAGGIFLISKKKNLFKQI